MYKIIFSYKKVISHEHKISCTKKEQQTLNFRYPLNSNYLCHTNYWFHCVSLLIDRGIWLCIFSLEYKSLNIWSICLASKENNIFFDKKVNINFYRTLNIFVIKSVKFTPFNTLKKFILSLTCFLYIYVTFF